MEDIRNRTHGGKKDESVNATIKSVDIYLDVMHYAFMRNEFTQESEEFKFNDLKFLKYIS